MRVAFQKSSLELLLLLVFDPGAALRAEVEQRDAIVDDTLLNFVVERTVSCE